MTTLIATLALSASAGPLSTTIADSTDTGDTRELPTLPDRDGTDSAPVVGGELVPNPDDWPDAAGIIMSNSWMDVECTGVLVTPDVVLTAGHCNIGIKRVILGTNNYDHGGEIIPVKQTFEYKFGTQPTASDNNGDYQPSEDVTVVVLQHAAAEKPRPIADGEIADRYVKDGAAVTIVGYGAHDPNGYQYDDKLRQADTTVSDADCSDLYNGCEPSVSPGGEMVAGGNGIDSCYGDSGGPLYLDTPEGVFLTGLTSRGPPPCGSWGSIYVRADAIVDYIEEVTGEQVGGSPPDPVAPPLYTTKNNPGTTVIDPRDPDGNDGLTYAIKTNANNGNATVDGTGTVTFQPETGFAGSDAIVVTVTDPAGYSADVQVIVKILSKREYEDATGQEAPRGCDSTGTGGIGFAGLLLAGLLSRRRR